MAIALYYDQEGHTYDSDGVYVGDIQELAGSADTGSSAEGSLLRSTGFSALVEAVSETSAQLRLRNGFNSSVSAYALIASAPLYSSEVLSANVLSVAAVWKADLTRIKRTYRSNYTYDNRIRMRS